MWPLVFCLFLLVIIFFFLDLQYVVVMYVFIFLPCRCYLLSVHFVVLFCFYCSVLCCCHALSLLWPPSSSEGRRGSWGAGGVPPSQRVRLGALHPRAAISSPAYRGASKPESKVHWKIKGRGKKVLGWAAKV